MVARYTISMQIFDNVLLSDFSTMRLGGPAAHLCEVHTIFELQEAMAWATARKLDMIVIGGGSNIVWQDSGFPGLVVVNHIEGYDVFEEDDSTVYVTVGAGENWDSVVERTVKAGLTGIEALSLIPGTTGATPVQNVGAYGQEVSQTISVVQALDRSNGLMVTLPAGDLGFSYRSSIFKTGPQRGRYIITSVTFRLTRGNPSAPYYGALQSYFTEHGLTDITPAVMRDAVIAIRSSKLPDPALVANNGSFFANPIVPLGVLTQIQADFTDGPVPNWPVDNGHTKIPAAWLLEHAGFKNYKDPETGMATWPAQPLVMVNESAASTAQLLAFKAKLVDGVRAKFGITLEQEPELLP